MKEKNIGIVNSINLNNIENLTLSELESRIEFSIIDPARIICDGILCDRVCDCVASVCDCVRAVCDQICDQVCDQICNSVCDRIW